MVRQWTESIRLFHSEVSKGQVYQANEIGHGEDYGSVVIDLGAIEHELVEQKARCAYDNKQEAGDPN